MTYLRISLLFLCCAFVWWTVNGQQHSSSYGMCMPNNNRTNSSIRIYSEVINIRNNGIVDRSPRPLRRWMNSVRDMFRWGRSTSTTVAPTQSGIRISQLFTYPPTVSTVETRRQSSNILASFFLCCFAGYAQYKSDHMHSN